MTEQNPADLLDYQTLFAIAIQKAGGYLEIAAEDLLNYPGFGLMPVEGSNILRFVTLVEDTDD